MDIRTYICTYVHMYMVSCRDTHTSSGHAQLYISTYMYHVGVCMYAGGIDVGGGVVNLHMVCDLRTYEYILLYVMSGGW